MRIVAVLGVLLISFGVALSPTICMAAGDGAVVQDGKHVSFDYTLTVDGKVIDSSTGKKPLAYVHGDGQLITGLTSRLAGMRAGEEKDVVIPPAEAYGMPIATALREVPRSSLGPDIAPVVGMMLQATTKDGQKMPVTIVEVKKDTVKLDGNHPLAGKTLKFHIKIISVK